MKARKRLTTYLGAAALCLCLLAPSAQADFGIADFSVAAINEDGTPATLAGSHPFEYTLDFTMNQDSGGTPEGTLRELTVELPPGLLGDPQALPRCKRADFDFNLVPACPGNTQIGIARVELSSGDPLYPGLYNLTPSPGSPATIGFSLDNHNSLQEASLRSASDYGVRVTDLTIPTDVEIRSVAVHVWGVPAAPAHDGERYCVPDDPELAQIVACESDLPPEPFLTLPASCTGPLETTLEVDSVEEPGVPKEASALSLDENEEPVGLEGCNQLAFEPSISSQPTTNLSDSPTGLEFDLHQPQPPAVQPDPGQRVHEAGKAEVCHAGFWANAPIAFAYRWLRNGTPIPGAEAREYVVQEADEGAALQCEVTATNAGGVGRSVSPAFAVEPVPATPLPVAGRPGVGVPPAIVGADKCELGNWTANPSFAYRWFLDGALVPGETGQSFGGSPTPPYTLQCEIIATNAAGTIIAFSSNANSNPPPDPALPQFVNPASFSLAEAPPPRATTPVKDVTVTLPEGMTLNPSAANGLGACSESQIGYLAGVPGIHFSEAPQSCPDAAKVGTLEVSSPLLDHEIEDGAGGARAAVYVAEPFENPFGSLLAIYLAIEDPATGIVAKLAGKVEPDPRTGQLKSAFRENPQLPIEDVTLHIFAGPEAALKTPLACGAHTTTSELVPWSAPEGANAHPSDSFLTSVAAGGSGPCPSSEAGAPNKVSFSAGTTSPQAGAFSPFLLRLSRPDGSQRLAGIDTTLPPGLSGKLAGVPYCPEGAIAQAKSREAPNKGVLEQRSPSCPASSEVGTVTVGAGAGISPFYAQGRAYLAGPYKGAPLSLVVIAPAVAGPFDLGAVLVRTALHVDPESARIHAVSDPLPSIIEGIPLDLRSIALKLDRPDFTLNPTSCDPMSIGGSALTLTGQSASLLSPFQVGGCGSLKYKPRLTLKLKGGTRRGDHPALTATVTAKPGEANTASVSAALPRSEFLDQAHIRTICTRVQFSSTPVPGEGCPKGSIYGKATAVTPLLEAPLTGPVFLRSSDHNLPDLVIALHGQVDVVLVGRIDSKRGGIRNSFEAAPDAPITRFALSMRGGKKGLLVNSRDICASKARATVRMVGQNGKPHDFAPVVRSGCKKGRGRGGHRGGR